jgi:hypothetical protein
VATSAKAGSAGWPCHEARPSSTIAWCCGASVGGPEVALDRAAYVGRHVGEIHRASLACWLSLRSITRHHLAQVNIARLRAPIDSPQLAEFVAGLVPVNALADAATGFVWRLQTEEGDATAIRPYDDDMVIVNMSVWTSVEALKAFVYGAEHRSYLARRREWFERMDEAIVALWWVEAGHRPTIDEAKDRLALLDRVGPSPAAFTFRTAFPAPEAAAGEGQTVV